MNNAKSNEEILKERARALARPAIREQARGQSVEVIEFRLAHERYAIEHAFVREVVTLRELTPLPCTPAFIAGVMNLRGQILPLLDIKKFFDLPQAGIVDLHVAIIVHCGDIELGIVADAIGGVSAIPNDAIQPSLPTLTGIRAKYLKGVTGDHIVILDISNILNDSKIVVDDEVKL